jgi:hypothetical protein
MDSTLIVAVLILIGAFLFSRWLKGGPARRDSGSAVQNAGYRERPGPAQRLAPDVEAQIHGLIEQGSKIEAIKFVRETTGWGLNEAKDYVDGLDQGN